MLSSHTNPNGPPGGTLDPERSWMAGVSMFYSLMLWVSTWIYHALTSPWWDQEPYLDHSVKLIPMLVGVLAPVAAGLGGWWTTRQHRWWVIGVSLGVAAFVFVVVSNTDRFALSLVGALLALSPALVAFGGRPAADVSDRRSPTEPG